MGVAVLVVEQRPPLNGILGRDQINLNDALSIGRCGFDRQFQRVERVAGIAASDVRQMGQGILFHLHLPLAVASFPVRQGAQQERPQLLFRQRVKLEDARAGN